MTMQAIRLARKLKKQGKTKDEAAKEMLKKEHFLDSDDIGSAITKVYKESKCPHCGN